MLSSGGGGGVVSAPGPASKRPMPLSRQLAQQQQQPASKKPRPSEMVSLEAYFYATLPGDSELLSQEFKADMAFKCTLCGKLYMNNIDFMKHLSLHVESDRDTAVDLADLCQCKYCFKDFDTPFEMQSHLEEAHLRQGHPFACKICEEVAQDKNDLGRGAVPEAPEEKKACREAFVDFVELGFIA